MVNEQAKRDRLEKLKSLWAKGKSLLIVMQNNPDPDAYGSPYLRDGGEDNMTSKLRKKDVLCCFLIIDSITIWLSGICVRAYFGNIHRFEVCRGNIG
jgi:hypothetical protein